MVVVVIIGLLAAVIVPNVFGKRREGAGRQGQERHPGHRDRAHHVQARQLQVSEHRSRPDRARRSGPTIRPSATGARAATSSASATIPGAIPINMCSPARAGRNTTCIRSAPTDRKAAKAPMPTLATGISVSNTARATRALRSAGFTLIEIMIVVFIIGLITAGAVITFGGDTPRHRARAGSAAARRAVRLRARAGRTADPRLRLSRRRASRIPSSCSTCSQNQWRAGRRRRRAARARVSRGHRAAGRRRRPARSCSTTKKPGDRRTSRRRS